jgi:hypothetical protein
LLFLLLLRQIISHDTAFAAGILGRRRSANTQNSGRARCSPLFSAVSGNISASFDRILMATTISNLKLLVNLTHAVCASI